MGPPQSPILYVLETIFPGIKRQGSEADQSSPFSAEFKNCGIVPSLLEKSSRRDN
jgi:hypothetical protein